MSLRAARAFSPANVAITGGNTWFAPSGGYSGVAVTAPADVSENALATLTLPSLSETAAFRLKFFLSTTSNANLKTIRVRLGGGAGTIILTANAAGAASSEFELLCLNRGATNSQVASQRGSNSGAGAYAALVATAAIETNAGTTAVITALKGTAGDTITLEGYSLEVLKP